MFSFVLNQTFRALEERLINQVMTMYWKKYRFITEKRITRLLNTAAGVTMIYSGLHLTSLHFLKSQGVNEQIFCNLWYFFTSGT